MNDDSVRKIVIVGGGTSGWMTASMLAKLLGPQIDITLVESDDIGIIGVGEATIPPIQVFNNVLGLDEDDFLSKTQGTIKLGIQFENWGTVGNKYMHAFGNIGHEIDLLPFHHYWLRAQADGDASDLWDYSFNYQVAKADKFSRLDKIPDSPLSGVTHAFHFDALLYAKYLRQGSEKLGVKRIEGLVIDTQLNAETGFIESISLKNGTRIEGDFFIDCTGFRSVLMGGALGVGYTSWADWCRVNRAIAVPTENGERLRPYTQSIAHSSGWQWRIPLQSRAGNGHVYCSDFMSEDEATDILLNNLEGETLADPRTFSFTVGRREKFWHKNCVAIGLSSGFLEPLESTAIHLIQNSVVKLAQMFPTMSFSTANEDEYNKQVGFEFERIRDFIIMHYKVSERTDSPYWRHYQDTEIPESLQHRIDLFKTTGRIFRENNELFAEAAWLQVMYGQGLRPQSYHPMADAMEGEKLQGFLADLKTIVDSNVKKLPSHKDFIARHFSATRQ
ncbi:MAG: tryptophan 7-halogenase [Emcibacter sp.]|nr:tryptophan 7-halogenase [Emcibacter sp.]